VDLFINLTLNQADILFRKKGDVLSAEDLKALKSAPSKAVRVKFNEIGDLTIYARAAQIKESLLREDFKSKEVKKAAVGMLATIGANPPHEKRCDTIAKISDKVQDIITAMKNTPSVKSYFRLMESAKKIGDPLDIHNREVSAIAVLILMTIGAKDGDELADIATAGLLHDIGLRLGPPQMLEAHCKGRNEYEGLEKISYVKHADASLQLIRQQKIQASPEVLQTVLHHHENWDGSGFKGVVGNRISRAARVIRTADELACALASASNEDQFDKVLSRISNLSTQSKTSIFDPDILLTLSATLQMK